MFCNDMDPDQARFVLEHCGAGGAFGLRRRRSPAAGSRAASRRRTCACSAIRRSARRVQDVQIANLRESPGGSVDVVEIDAGHDVMVSRPEALADVP